MAQRKKASKKPAEKTTVSGGLDLGSLSSFVENKIPTGIYPLDLVLGGGYEKGDMIEVTSESGVGKSTTMLDLCSRECGAGRRTLYIDVERGVKPDHINKYQLGQYMFKRDGKGSFEDDFLCLKLRSFKEVDQVLFRLLYNQEAHYDHIIIDSISALVSSLVGTADNDVEAHTIGPEARIITKLMAKYKGALFPSGTTAWVLNQARVKMRKKGMGMEVTVEGSGGYAQTHYPDIRLRLEKGPALKRVERVLGNEQEVVIGNIARIWAVKNRSERPEIRVNFPVIFGAGVSNSLFMKDFATDCGIISGGGGGHYKIHLPTGEVSVRGADTLTSEIIQNLHAIKDAIEEKGLWKLVTGISEVMSDEEGLVSVPEGVENESPS